MTTLLKLWRTFRQAVRRNHDVVVGGILHVATALMFAGMLYGLVWYLPTATALSELESSIQLLSQILAVVVGVLLVGTTVSLGSYDASPNLNAIQLEIDKAVAPFFAKFFSRGRSAHKIDRKLFRDTMLARPGVQMLQFFDPASKAEDQWFIYRPHWDGVWYQVGNSPFADASRTLAQLAQVRAIHEVAICAHTVVRSVWDLRKAGCTLVTKLIGTNGSRKFISRIETHVSIKGVKLPPMAYLSHIQSVVSLAIASEHYMREEFRKHSENTSWGPYVLTKFQLAFDKYVLALIQLVGKLQVLRLTNAAQRCSTAIDHLGKKTLENLYFDELGKLQEAMKEIRAKIVMAHGAARYIYSIKRMSIPGIGLALLALVALLVGWPFIRATADTSARLLGFAVLYSLGIAALIESSWFLGRLLWKRHTAE